MDFVRIQLLCVGKHNDLKLIANFVLDFAGIATGTHEIHNVFNQKMMTKWPLPKTYCCLTVPISFVAQLSRNVAQLSQLGMSLSLQSLVFLRKPMKNDVFERPPFENIM